MQKVHQIARITVCFDIADVDALHAQLARLPDGDWLNFGLPSTP